MKESKTGASGNDLGDLIRITRRLFNKPDQPNWARTAQQPRQPWIQRLIARVQSLDRVRLLAGALFLFALVLLIYLPLLPGSFVMDDQRLVKDANPLVNGELTPASVWFQTDFPLTLCAWWAQWLMWGNNPGGYHAVNIALQAISAILLWRTLAQLKIPGAWLAAAIFAAHPVEVGSVARIAELKNTLSLPFFLMSFWGYLRYEALSLYPDEGQPASDPQSRRHGTWWFGFSFIAFVLALLSKTSTIMLPVALLGCAAWQRGRITRRDLVHTAPYFGLALAFGWMSVWFQKYQALAGTNVLHQSLVERLSIAGQNFWFYFGKAVLPVNLTVFYSRWRTDVPMWAAIVPALLAIALFLAGWKFRRSWGKHALFGLGCFAILLFPALGFFDAQCFTKFQVSDHLQYLPLIALVSLTVGASATLLNGKVFRITAVALLLIVSLLSFKRAQLFASEEALMRDTLAKNPAAGPVHNALGVILAKQGKFPEAMEHFKASLQFQPDDADVLANLGLAYFMQHQFAEASAEYLAAVKAKPSAPQPHEGLARALEALGKDREAIAHLNIALRLAPKTETRLGLAGLLYRDREFHETVEQYRQVLLVEPDNVAALNNLACVMTTCPDKTIRNGVEAITLAERACRVTHFKQIPAMNTLSAAYTAEGRLPEAAAVADIASRLELAVSEGPTPLPILIRN